MASCKIQLKTAVAFISFVTVTCKEMGLFEPTSPLQHSGGFPKHIPQNARGLARIHLGSPPISQSQATIPDMQSLASRSFLNFPKHGFLRSLAAKSRPATRSHLTFSRISRSRLNRMPLQFGKRLDFITKSILSTHDLSGNNRPPREENEDVNEEVKNYLKTFSRMQNQILYSPKRNLSLNLDGSWRDDGNLAERNLAGEESNRDDEGFRAEGGFISQKETRGALDRMPAGFGKRNNVKISPFLQQISKEGNPAYERAIKRLANKFGIRFLRGSRARLSRMPQLYGRKRRDNSNIEDIADTDDDNVMRLNSNDVTSQGVKLIRNPTLEPGSSNFEAKDDHPISNAVSVAFQNTKYKKDLYSQWRSLTSTLLLDLIKHKSSISSRDQKDSKSLTSKKVFKDFPRIETSRRSTLSRMPLSFGKRYIQDAHPATLTEIHSNIEDNRASEGTHVGTNTPYKTIWNPLAGDQVTPGAQRMSLILQGVKPNLQNHQQIVNIVGSKTSQLYDIPNTQFNSQENLLTDRRSALSRMPLSFGKRNVFRGNVEDIQRYPEVNRGTGEKSPIGLSGKVEGSDPGSSEGVLREQDERTVVRVDDTAS